MCIYIYIRNLVYVSNLEDLFDIYIFYISNIPCGLSIREKQYSRYIKTDIKKKQLRKNDLKSK